MDLVYELMLSLVFSIWRYQSNKCLRLQTSKSLAGINFEQISHIVLVLLLLKTSFFATFVIGLN